MSDYAPGDADSFVSAFFPRAKARSRGQWQAPCPAHDDKSPSLSIGQGDKGVILKCFAGCTTEAICTKLGIQMSALMKPQPRSTNGHQVAIIKRTEYTYKDEAGQPLYRRVRVDYADGGKQVYQDRAEGNRWVSGLGDVRRVLYRLPELLHADPSEPVFWVEGEKCADILVKHGQVATTSGSATSWREEFAPLFKGRVVVILPDNDDEGRRFARLVAGSIQRYASKVFYLELPGLAVKDDVYDWLTAGHTVDELIELALDAAWQSPSPTQAPAATIDLTPAAAPVTIPTETATGPDLPAEAQAVYAHLAPCSAWLDEYVAFASHAAPMTPASFHETAALFAVSVAVARRLVLRASTAHIFPNLYTLFIAPSSKYRKTTGFKIVRDLFEAAGMQHYLLPQRMTPEAMLQELSLTVPTNYALGDQTTKEQWLRERAIAAQRGWAIDEAQGLFDGLRRDYNTGLLPMLLDLYECPPQLTEQTIGRWRTRVERPYIAFFGASTPAAMAEHLANSTLWTNGLWARFALVVPEEEPHFAFFPPAIELPTRLVEGIQRIAALFPTPSARIVEVEDADGAKRKAIELSGAEPPSTVILADGVWRAWEIYTQALFEMTVNGDVAQEELHGNYNRLGTHLAKVAMLLATIDATSLPITVELRHFARAQQIVESWRQSLHRLRRANVVKHEENMADKILAMLTEAAPKSLSTRLIYRPLGLSAPEARPLLEELMKQGLIQRRVETAANGKDVEMWTTLCTNSGNSVNNNRVN